MGTSLHQEISVSSLKEACRSPVCVLEWPFLPLDGFVFFSMDRAGVPQLLHLLSAVSSAGTSRDWGLSGSGMSHACLFHSPVSFPS